MWSVDWDILRGFLGKDRRTMFLDFDGSSNILQEAPYCKDPLALE